MSGNTNTTTLEDPMATPENTMATPEATTTTTETTTAARGIKRLRKPLTAEAKTAKSMKNRRRRTHQGIQSEREIDRTRFSKFRIYLAVEFSLVYSLDSILKYDLLNLIHKFYKGIDIPVGRLYAEWIVDAISPCSKHHFWIRWSKTDMEFTIVRDVCKNGRPRQPIKMPSYNKVSTSFARLRKSHFYKYAEDFNQMLPDAVVEEGSWKFSQTKWGVSLILARSLIRGRVSYHLDWAPKNGRVFESSWEFEENLDSPLLIAYFETIQVLKNCGFIRREDLNLLEFPYPAPEAMVSNQIQVVYVFDIPTELCNEQQATAGDGAREEEGEDARAEEEDAREEEDEASESRLIIISQLEEDEEISANEGGGGNDDDIIILSSQDDEVLLSVSQAEHVGQILEEDLVQEAKDLSASMSQVSLQL